MGATNDRVGTTTRLRPTSLAYYLGGTLLLVAIVLKLQRDVLPAGLARQLGHNSEVVALALAVAATIQFARPRWLPARRPWALVSVVAVFWTLAALAVFYLDLPSSVRTLNEPLLAAGLLTLHMGSPRPLRRSWLVPLLVVVVVVVGFHTDFVRQQAESLVAVFVVAISLDQVDRSVLNPALRTRSWAWVWYLFLLVWPAAMLALNDGHDVTGFLGHAVDYQARGAEGFWGALVICGYFAVLRRAEARPI